MTIPKPISDAIDNFESKDVDHWMHDHYGTDRATFDAKRRLVTDARAALEAAIAAAIQPVEPPTDAEVEAWERMRERVQKALDANRSNPMIGTAVCAEEDCLRMVRGWIDEAQQELGR